MNNYEFMSYKQFPEDMYTTAMAKIRVDRKYIFTFVQKKTKEGNLFWAAPSTMINEGGEKKYHSAHMLDSQFESEMLIEFIKDNVKKVNSAQTQMTGSVFTAPVSQGVAADEQLPF